MAEVSRFRQPSEPGPTEPALTTRMTSTLSGTIPELHPHFVFPVELVSWDNAEPPSESHPPSANIRRSLGDRLRPERLSLSALPSFEFNPSHSSDSAGRSPGRSPSMTATPYSSQGTPGHRRNGSEFIGGDGNQSGDGRKRSSPTKGEGTLQTSAWSPSRLSPGRRRHAHRRSGAVSSHDLSDVLKLSLEPRGSSLPATPSDPNDDSKLSPFLPRSTSQPEVSLNANILPSASTGEGTPTGVQPRSRVGFSDTIEFIPRPLSTISSDASSSLSTIRVNHSVSGSTTSLVSSGTSSPPLDRLSRSSTELVKSRGELQSRPGTADITTLDAAPSRTADRPSLFFQPPVSSSEAIRHTTPINTDITARNDGDQPAPPPDRFIDDIQKRDGDVLDVPPRALKLHHFHREPIPTDMSRPRSSPEPKVVKREKEVNPWAGSKLSRKTRASTPTTDCSEDTDFGSSIHSFAPLVDLSAEDIDFDDDTTCVIRDPSHIAAASRVHIDTETPCIGHASAFRDEDPNSVLDLDAILGFDSEDIMDGGFPTARRRMHSSGATGGFSGRGMHYRRRAESAPEMAPFDYHTFGFPRFNSNPGMADVFEEEEEDNDRPIVRNDHTNKGGIYRTISPGMTENHMSIGLGVSVVDIGSIKDEAAPVTIPHRISKPHAERNMPTGEIQDLQVPAAASTFLAQAPVEIVGADEEPRAILGIQSSEGSSVMPSLSNNPCLTRPPSAPMADSAVLKPSVPYAIPEAWSSAVSSPDYNRTSFDVPRLYTANSPTTDRATLSSCRVGDQGLSFRGSVDDVPSLISSASTVISAQAPRMSSSAYTNSSGDRSSSLSAAVQSSISSPAGKRSSLASLSRLVGSSYGEKSKLNIEEHAPSEITDKVEKKKGNRISRLMRFWKPRERPAS